MKGSCLFLFVLSFIYGASQVPTLYGLTYTGGAVSGAGTIFSIKGDGADFTKRAQFNLDISGYEPQGTLVFIDTGLYYGINSKGGTYQAGLIFSYNVIDSVYTELFSLTDPTQKFLGDLVKGTDGLIYGLTGSVRSDTSSGCIFSFNPSNNIFNTVFNFQNVTGSVPVGSLFQASDGKLYGMTCKGGVDDYGVLFSYDISNSNYSVIQNFNDTIGLPGFNCKNVLMQATDGQIYGTTTGGGSNGGGTLFSYSIPNNQYNLILSFADSMPGPTGSLVEGTGGKLYGITVGLAGVGTTGSIFSYDIGANSFNSVYSFNQAKGTKPCGGLTYHRDNLYGMTTSGSRYGAGALFSYNVVTNVYSILQDFYVQKGVSPDGRVVLLDDSTLIGLTRNGGDFYSGTIFKYAIKGHHYSLLQRMREAKASFPKASLYQCSDGKFYGTTINGGKYGAGTIFSFDSRIDSLEVVHDFNYLNSGYPSSDNFMQADDGYLYSVTTRGGRYDDGTIYRFDPVSKDFEVVVDFFMPSFSWGEAPFGTLIPWLDNRLYGITSGGGNDYMGKIYSLGGSTIQSFFSFNDTVGYPVSSLFLASDYLFYGTTIKSSNFGSIYRYNPTVNDFQIIYTLSNIDSGVGPMNLLEGDDHKLYGMTQRGGTYDFGVIFSLDPDTKAYRKLYDFDYNSGASPAREQLMKASDGNFYGMTRFGGLYDQGVIFRFNPVTKVFAKLLDFDNNTGALPYGKLIESKNFDVAVSSLASLEEIFLYPVPTGDRLNVNCSERNIQIKIYNSAGYLMLYQNHDKNIDVSSLASGYYIAEIVTPKFTKRISWVKI